MSTSEIIAELPHLTDKELRAVERCIAELTSQRTPVAPRRDLWAERRAGCLVLAGAKVVRQAEVEAILEEFP